MGNRQLFKVGLKAWKSSVGYINIIIWQYFLNFNHYNSRFSWCNGSDENKLKSDENKPWSQSEWMNEYELSWFLVLMQIQES